MARARLAPLRLANAFCRRRLNSSPDFSEPSHLLEVGLAASRCAFAGLSPSCAPTEEVPVQSHPIAAPATKVPTTHPLMETLVGVMTGSVFRLCPAGCKSVSGEGEEVSAVRKFVSAVARLVSMLRKSLPDARQLVSAFRKTVPGMHRQVPSLRKLLPGARTMVSDVRRLGPGKGLTFLNILCEGHSLALPIVRICANNRIQ